ncbi:MAG: MFS transporter [Promethearchaeota archaeon]
MEQEEYKYKNSYTLIFGLLYLTQGIIHSAFASLVPIYILTLLGSVEAADVANLGTTVMLPFICKLIMGILTDKFGTNRLGRRKPWIIGSTLFAGICWLFIPSLIFANPQAAFMIFSLTGLIIMSGVAMSDTAMDGYILDICPPRKLGTVNGTCWGARSLGVIVGGPAILLFVGVTAQILIVFYLLGILTIIFGLLTLYIETPAKYEKMQIVEHLKVMVKSGENWKVFAYSFFMAITDGVVFIFLALYVLIRAGLVNPVGATINLLEEDVNLFGPQAIITLITGLGILIGSIVNGKIADIKSRRVAVVGALIFKSVSLLVILLPVPIILLLILALLVGISSGFSTASYFAVATQYSKKYPESTSTYFSISLSFINLGTVLGISLTGIIFRNITAITQNIFLIYAVVFISMVILNDLAIFPFLLMKRENYELPRQGSEFKELIKP